MPEVIIGRDEEDTRLFGTEGTLFIGKHLVGTGEEAHLTSPVLLDALRPHVICITGKRGYGKCLHEDTLVTLDDGSCVPIKELENKEGKVVCLNDNLKVQVAEKEGFYKRVTDKLVHLKLRSGREIKLTPEHPLLTITGWKPVQDLKIGGRIAVPRILPDVSAKKMPEHEIKLLAYLIAEGHIAKGYVVFSNKDKKIVQDFRDALEKFDANLHMKQMRDGMFRVCQIKKAKKSHVTIVRNKLGQIAKGSGGGRYDKRSIIKWLEALGIYGKLSKDKFVPQDVLKSEITCIRLFLNRLFSCDGSIYKTAAWQISYSTISEKVIRQVQHLLLRFGVLSKIRTKKTKCNEKYLESFEIVIDGEFVEKFVHEIGFFGKKEERQQEALQERKKRNPNVDTIPKGIWGIYKPASWAALGRHFNYAYPKAMRESMDYAPSRQKLLQIAGFEKNEALRLLAESDIFWDEIVSMELLEGTYTVYDITVPEYHNFTANDIIVHNSYGIGVIAEEFARLPDKIKRNLCALIVDTQGIFWTMKSPNEQDISLLRSWNLAAQGFKVQVYIPAGQEKLFVDAGIEFDATFSFQPGDLGTEDWLALFSLTIMEPAGVLLQNALAQFNGSYTIEDVIGAVEMQEGFDKEKLIIKNLLRTTGQWGIFGASKMPSILEPGKITILDMSLSPQNVRSLLLALVARKLFHERTEARRKEELFEMDKKIPFPWILIDEAHNFAPSKGKTPASDIIDKIVKEGRQPGISVVFATQRLGRLHAEILSQCDVIIAHRLTAKVDIEALKSIMQTYMLFDIAKDINDLPRLKGAAVVLDDNSERIYKIRIRPRQSWHGGSSPLALPAKESMLLPLR
ncbi:MAG: hypothetical protein HYY37_06580 [Candidatus Aenigmarchaeota archaeon]|nr:hypothetical protein [Candidatus Aenigmarchaeota archaeon]